MTARDPFDPFARPSAGGPDRTVPRADPHGPTEPLGERGAADDGLDAWMADLATDGAIRDRARTQWLTRQATEEGTFTGVLADLGERNRPVLVHLHNGRLHRGAVAAVGADYCVVRLSPGRQIAVALAAIASVRTLPGEPPVSGDRWVTAAGTMSDLLAELAAERAWVLILGSDSGHGVSGEIRAAGRDVVTVRLDGAGGTAYVALASVAEISLPVSG